MRQSVIASVTAEDRAAIEAVLARHHQDGTRLMQILRETQEALGWLSVSTLKAIAQAVRLPLARVQGVAGFYSFFHTRPMGRYRVLWSDNITDQMAGNRVLMDQMLKRFWLQPGQVSADGLVSIDTTSCTGLGDQGPAILVNYRAIPRMSPERVDQVCDLIRHAVPVTDWPATLFAIDDNIHRRDLLLGHDLQPGDALKNLNNPQRTLQEIKHSGLRGRGGAGFSTGQKWEFCRNATGNGDHPAHYVICNADEGEPGTFKDRVLLTRYADLVFEGMTVAGYVIGAHRGYLYLRGEYRHLLDPLNEVLARRRSQKLLGPSILGRTGFDFDIEIHLGAGAYVCGEESALIESLEGKRGIPRNRPPFPVTNGFLNQPTVVNNVETLAAAALIAARGGAWYRAFGTEKSAGTKIHSISGDCARPGLYEYPFGVTIAEILADCGAENVMAVQVGGASGICLAPEEFGRKIAFEDVPTAGALMVFGPGRDMVEVARNFAHFFAHESCGFCTPCRVGTTLLKNIMDKIHDGHAAKVDLKDAERINVLLHASAHCGLGTAAGNAVFDTLRKFAPTYSGKLTDQEFEPAFDLDAALSKMRQITGRDDHEAHLPPTGIDVDEDVSA